jgi:F-box domain
MGSGVALSTAWLQKVAFGPSGTSNRWYVQMSPGQQTSSMRVVRDEKGAARQAFLDDVVSELTPWEWRDLYARLGACKFSFDVFGNLPIELVLCVASYLEDLDIISLRRVSKRWQEILRSEELCRKVCFQHNFTIQRQLSTEMTWEAFLSHKSGIQHSLVHGRPWAKYLQHTSFGRDDLRNVVYHNGMLAVFRYYKDSDRLYCIDIYHFDSGEISSRLVHALLPLPVGPVHAMALSDSLFACVLNRYGRLSENLSIWEISEGLELTH